MKKQIKSLESIATNEQTLNVIARILGDRRYAHDFVKHPAHEGAQIDVVRLASQIGKRPVNLNVLFLQVKGCANMPQDMLSDCTPVYPAEIKSKPIISRGSKKVFASAVSNMVKRKKDSNERKAYFRRQSEMEDRGTRQVWLFCKKTNEIFDQKLTDTTDDGLLSLHEMTQLMACFSAVTCCDRVLEKYHLIWQMNDVAKDFVTSFFKSEKDKFSEYLAREYPNDDRFFANYNMGFLRIQFILFYVTFTRFKLIRDQKRREMSTMTPEKEKYEEKRMMTIVMLASIGEFLCTSRDSQPDVAYAMMLLAMSRDFYFDHEDVWTTADDTEMYKHIMDSTQFKEGEYLVPKICLTSGTYRGMHPTKTTSLKNTILEGQRDTVHQRPAGDVPFKTQEQWHDFLLECDEERGNKPRDLPQIPLTNEEIQLLATYDRNISYIQSAIYGIPSAVKRFGPTTKQIEREEVKDSDDDSDDAEQVGDLEGKDGKNKTRNNRQRSSKCDRKASASTSDCGKSRNRRRPRDFVEQSRIDVINRQGRYVQPYPFLTCEPPTDKTLRKGIRLQATKELLNLQMVDVVRLEKSALAQLVRIHSLDGEMIGIEKKFLQLASSGKTKSRSFTFSFSYKGSDETDLVFLADSKRSVTARFPYDFKEGASRLLSDYGRNMLMFQYLNLRCTNAPQVIPVVDLICDGKTKKQKPDDRQPSDCRGFALFSMCGTDIEMSSVTVKEFLTSASHDEIEDFFKVFVTFAILNFRNMTSASAFIVDEIPSVSKPSSMHNYYDDEDTETGDASEQSAPSTSSSQLPSKKQRVLFVTGEGQLCNTKSISFRHDFLRAVTGEGDETFVSSTTFATLVNENISEEEDKFMTEKMVSVRDDLRQFVANTKASLTSSDARTFFSKRIPHANDCDILEHVHYTCTVVDLFLERLKSGKQYKKKVSEKFADYYKESLPTATTDQSSERPKRKKSRKNRDSRTKSRHKAAKLYESPDED